LLHRYLLGRIGKAHEADLLLGQTIYSAIRWTPSLAQRFHA